MSDYIEKTLNHLRIERDQLYFSIDKMLGDIYDTNDQELIAAIQKDIDDLQEITEHLNIAIDVLMDRI